MQSRLCLPELLNCKWKTIEGNRRQITLLANASCPDIMLQRSMRWPGMAALHPGSPPPWQLELHYDGGGGRAAPGRGATAFIP